MARIAGVTSGGNDYFRDDLPVELIDELLTAEADVIEPLIRENAKKMLSGPYSTGLSEKSLARKPPGYGKDKSRQLVLVWRGTRREFIKNGKAVRRKEIRNAEGAFLNEYGTRNNPPRPFISDGIDRGEKSAFDNAEVIFRSWQEKNI